MDNFVAQVQSIAVGEKINPVLVDFVRKAVVQLLPNNLAVLDNALQSFQTPTHSIGILAILHVKLLKETPAADSPFWVLVQDFLASFCPNQMRAIPDLFVDFCHHYTNALIQRTEYSNLINQLSQTIRSFCTSTFQLTSLHADLFQVCLLARNFQPALNFLDVDITDIATETTPFDAKYFLLYYYYGGMIYAALKRFGRALNFFEIVLTTPAFVVSQIMVEAYKKYILICLLLKGRVQHLPKYTSPIVQRFVKPMCQPYTDLMSAYGTLTTEKFRKALLKHHDLLTRDQNYGLANQVLDSINKRNIQKLTNTFITLSLADVASRCNLSSSAHAEKYLVSMIEEKEIYATIDKRDGMVYFHDNPEKFDSPDVLNTINEDLESSLKIYQDVEKLDIELYLVPQYVHKVTKQPAAYNWIHEDEGLGVGASASGGSDSVPALGGF